MAYQDKHVAGYVAVGAIVLVIVLVMFGGKIFVTSVASTSSVQNGQFTQVGLASLSSPFYSDFAITPAVLSGTTQYVNGSAVYNAAVNQTIYGGTSLLGTVVIQLSGAVGSLQLTPLSVFNDSSLINSSVFGITSLDIVTYTGGQQVYADNAVILGKALQTGALGAGQYALEVNTHFNGKVVMPAAAKDIELFKLDGQLTGTSTTGAAAFNNFAFNVKS